MNLYDSLGLAYIEHPAHQDETTVDLVPQNLVYEREVVFVGEKQLIGGSREMILEDVQDQLVDNAAGSCSGEQGPCWYYRCNREQLPCDWQGPPGKRQ
jgi:hypothetical protein